MAVVSVGAFAVLLLLATYASDVESARFLGFFPVPSYSHQIVYRAYMQELARRGHEVTIITPDPIKKPLPRYNEIDVSYSYENWTGEFKMVEQGDWWVRNVPELFVSSILQGASDLCDLYFTDPNVTRLIQEKEQYDAFIVEFGFLPCSYPFALQSNNITIGIASLDIGIMPGAIFGGTGNPAYIPEQSVGYTSQMNLWQRLRNFLHILYLVAFVGPKHHTVQQKAAEKYFGPNIPHIMELTKNINLIMPHAHFSSSYPRPRTQAIVEIGGPPLYLHGRESNSLPKDLQEFLDDAPHGIIYLSFGSNVKSSQMPEEKRAMFLSAFRNFKEKILWKWETDQLPGKPDNVKISQWTPQLEVLAHPNVKLFITQGGLQSMGEAIYNKVPMVVIPFFGDQDMNAAKLESVGIARSLDYANLTTEGLVEAIKDVADNPKYKENIVRYSDMTRDQPMSPMDRAIWWTEYVLRHKGARHLRSPALDVKWYQYLMLDVIGFLLIVSSAILYVTVFVSKRLIRLVYSKQKTKSE